MSGIIGGAGSKSGIIGETEIDYEEGTSDVTFTAASGTSTTDTTRNTLAYTKIGNRVTFTGYARIGGTWTGTGDLSFNLPFLSAPHTEYSGSSFGIVVPENLRQSANDPQSRGTPFYNTNDFHVSIGASTSTATIKVTGGTSNAGATADASPQSTAATQCVVYTNFTFNVSYQITPGY